MGKGGRGGEMWGHLEEAAVDVGVEAEEVERSGEIAGESGCPLGLGVGESMDALGHFVQPLWRQLSQPLDECLRSHGVL